MGQSFEVPCIEKQTLVDASQHGTQLRGCPPPCGLPLYAAALSAVLSRVCKRFRYSPIARQHCSEINKHETRSQQ
jgi:hypothetical protein